MLVVIASHQASSKGSQPPKPESPHIPRAIHDPAFEREMRQAAATHVQQLVAEGRKSISSLNLEDLERDIAKVRWEKFGDGFLAGSGEQRSSSIYFVEDKRVVFNQLSLQYTPKAMLPLIALHESLGALGYEDEDYQLTLGILFHQKDLQDRLGLTDEDLAPIFGNIKVRSSTPIYLSAASDGGSTSVGGGGDSAALDVKLTTLLASKAWLESRRGPPLSDYPTLFRHLLNLSFESSFEALPKENFRLEKKESKFVLRTSLIAWLNASRRGTTDTVLFVFEILDKIRKETL